MKSVIIDRLIEIEENARSITSGIDKRVAGLPVMINAQCDEIEKSLKAEYAKRSREIEESLEDECKKRLAEIERDYQEREKALDKSFEQNHRAWENEIFNKIIGR